jgi:D-glycero-D-manno-heptose 1,7-bisphosphate phosphatase
MKPALFLDRDGVINVDHAYVYRKEDFHFVEGVFELVTAAKAAGYLVVIVTNQAGIGRGYYTEADFHKLMGWVKEQFVQRGGFIDGIYFCPYHPEHGVGAYRQESHNRKPNPGMLLQAAQEFDIDMTKSIMLGDKESDAEAGLAAGVGILLHLGVASESGPAKPIGHLREALEIFKNMPLMFPK